MDQLATTNATALIERTYSFVDSNGFEGDEKEYGTLRINFEIWEKDAKFIFVGNARIYPPSFTPQLYKSIRDG